MAAAASDIAAYRKDVDNHTWNLTFVYKQLQ
jgi:hypothetical protein